MTRRDSAAPDYAAIAAELAAAAPVEPERAVMPESPSTMERWVGHQRRILAEQGPALDAHERWVARWPS